MKPQIDNYLSLSQTPRLDDLCIKQHDVLVSCSGTIGNVALGGQSITGMALSQHAIRIRTGEPETAGFIAAFLRNRFGRLQLTQATYGSVVVHIEPDHLKNVLVPEFHPVRRTEIGRRMLRAVELRDQANALLDEADKMLHERLRLPYLDTLVSIGSRPSVSTVRASALKMRFEGSFHNPAAKVAEARLRESDLDITTLGDESVTREVRPITKFRKRVYVDHGGIPMLSSKQLFQIDPIDVKRLAKGAHSKDMIEIELAENMLAVTRSGTVGKVQIIPRYMTGWAGSEHATRVLVANGMSPGYVYAWLSSDFGRSLLRRLKYGSVVVEIDKEMFSSVPIPFVRGCYELPATSSFMTRASISEENATRCNPATVSGKRS